MTYSHTVRYLRISQKKLALVGKVVRGLTAPEAVRQLMQQPQKGARFLAKAITAAQNNAEQQGVKLDNMIISSISAQRGPTFMRRWIKPKGRATPKRKPTSHAVVLFVERQVKNTEKQAETPKAQPAKKTTAPKKAKEVKATSAKPEAEE